MHDHIAIERDSAARHLLHNLRNAKELRHNPLVAHLLTPSGPGAPDAVPDRIVIARVAQAVAAVLRDLAASQGNASDHQSPHRQSEIIRRCVLGTEPYKAVARDLGISLRTLFRDLDGIRLRLVEELPRYAPTPVDVVAATDTFELELRHAHLLRNMGRFDDALRVLDRLSANAQHAMSRARLANASAYVHLDSGATEKSVAALAEARSALGAARAESPDVIVASADLDLTDAMIARVRGDTRAAIDSYSRAAAGCGPLLDGTKPAAVDVFVRAQAQAAVFSWLIGETAESSRAVERGWTAFESVADASDAAHYALLAASSLVRLVADGDVAWAIREMSAAAVLAERHGMLHDALMALGWLSSLERLNGDLAGAVRTSRSTIAIARGSMTGTEFAQLCAAAAENEASFGNPHGALELIEEARKHVAPGGSGWARLLLGEAGARLAAGDFAATIATAELAFEAMQRQGKAVFVGAACLYKALAHERRGERAQALLAARETLSLLERYGKSPDLAQAYALSARLTGSRRHQQYAIELTRLLKS
ncbi:MAG TPA: hypothetical protein VEJ20_03290 [Candidatus Eremiobacteraceae bacterium]|nr:hypothetical protein [Candidatus Eremiobacteraceae bacterium]